MSNWYSNPIILALATAVTGIILYSTYHSTDVVRRADHNVQLLESQVAATRAEVEAKQQEFIDSQSELRQEKIRRDELLLKKEGDIILQLPDLIIPSPTPQPTPTPPTPWEEWKKLLVQ